MGLFSIFKRSSSDSSPRIRNRKEAHLLFLDATGDERLADVLSDVAEQIGCDGFIEVERGGTGRPYEVKYHEAVVQDCKTSSIQSARATIMEQISAASSESQRHHLKKQLARLAGSFCTVSINVTTSDDFIRQRGLIETAWPQFQSIVKLQ